MKIISTILNWIKKWFGFNSYDEALPNVIITPHSTVIIDPSSVSPIVASLAEENGPLTDDEKIDFVNQMQAMDFDDDSILYEDKRMLHEMKEDKLAFLRDSVNKPVQGTTRPFNMFDTSH